ncbi:MAG: hypothetical protein K2Y18_02160 [Alphaproteobacteria bacterium]|jgi:hypothetical protein|nr:hypothetical protein [Alphaproteobacteria bacterium]
MENIENDKMNLELSPQYEVVLHESASELTQGGQGRGTEHRFAYMWPK